MISTPPLRTVRLYGALGKKFGTEFKLAVRSPAEAIRLLEANFPDEFTGHIRKGFYRVTVGDKETGMHCNLNMVQFNFPKGDIHIMQVPAGRKSGSSGKAI